MEPPSPAGVTLESRGMQPGEHPLRMRDVVLRPAEPDEATAISALAQRSKAHWGYGQEFLVACRDDLTIDPLWCDGTHLGDR